MNNDPLVFQLQIARDKPHSYRSDQKQAHCPFCDVVHLTDIYQRQGEMIWLKNKFPTLKDTLQTVLIESPVHHGDISSYSKVYNRRLMKFALRCFNQVKADPRFRSVAWYKNFGPWSGGSLIHPHMQIVGLEHEDCYKYIQPNHFEGVEVYRDADIEVNVAEHTVQGYTELNVNTLQQVHLDLWADWIRAATKYMLGKMYDKRCQSYNLFFYPRDDGGICAKLVSRFYASPYFVGYKLSQVNDAVTLAETAADFRNFFEKELDVNA